ncbi:MAG TPA: phage tail protein [Ruminiclostridium sp.]|nr:phage tail protein [Ruminiclostridium sp.]
MDEDFIGDICLFAFNFVPQNYMLCDGSSMNITQNQALYSLIGCLYGGNGTTTFNIPNLLGTEPIPGMKYYICTSGIYPPRQ